MHAPMLGLAHEGLSQIDLAFFARVAIPPAFAGGLLDDVLPPPLLLLLLLLLSIWLCTPLEADADMVVQTG